MNRLLLSTALVVLLLAGLAPAASAQVSDVLPTSQLQWDIDATSATVAQSYAYNAYVDAVKGPAMAGITCVLQALVPIVPTKFTCTTGPVSTSAPALLTAGTHALDVTATFNGTETVHSNALTVTVVPASPTATTLVLTGTLPTATYTATVVGGASTPTGTLVFKDNGVIRQTSAVNTAGQATWTSVLAIGTHTVTAEYSGGGVLWANSVSAPLTTVVSLGVPSGLRIIR